MVIIPLPVGAIALGAGLAYAKHDNPPSVGSPPGQVGDIATSATPGSGSIGGTPFTLASVTAPEGGSNANYMVSASQCRQSDDPANGRRVVCDIQRVADGTNLAQAQATLGPSGFGGSVIQTQTLTLTGAVDPFGQYRLVCLTQSPSGGVTLAAEAELTALRI